MIHTTLGILKDKLNEYFGLKTDVDHNLINFIESNNNDPVTFATDSVTPFLINISEDRKFRNPDLYSGMVQDGIRTQINPEIRIELLVLFVSKFNDYSQALKFLSYVIKFFQANRVFTQNNTPELLDENIEKLTIELVTLPLEEQNQVWHSLNTSYLPSVLYRVRLLSFIDDITIKVTGSSINDLQMNIKETTTT
ncbi:DUF4255 domain-containing protein [Flavobacterium jejuense]|uniref:DUF4255 domain-containing protein n=1 Tax=Flavobacterium jejuense TaxID=1544455 RepID=A0ABX0IMR0_9FLAO|nr:DUF4255 domain-containing protein [Flavobacterium jejuense]NHN24064.1 DUF4255 domain-containing protein [Flavobacterium jejuense]